MPQPVPPLFDRVPAALFAPLAGAYAPLYWSILARLYEHEFEREVSYLLRETAVEIAEGLLVDSPLWVERREELAQLDAELDDGAAPPAASDEAALGRAAARRLCARLERAGWFHCEYRSTVGHVVAFHPYAARILEALVRVARDEQPLFQGYAHSIVSLLRPESVAARPGVALREARRHALDMLRELKILERNIFAFTRRVLEEATSAAGVLEEGLERYRSAVMANYHRLKTVDNLYKWRSEILARLEAIERDPITLEAAARWYAEQDGVSALDAAQRARADIALLRAEFDALPALVAEIDRRNARFSGVALRKLMYLLRHDRRLEGQLQLLVDRQARDQAPELEMDVFRCELLGEGFLYTPPKKRPKPQRRPLARRPRPDGQALRRAIAPGLRRPFARDRINAHVERLLAGRSHAGTSELPLAADEDYLRAIYVLAYGLDAGSPYRFERIAAVRERARRGRYAVPAGTLRRRR